jgi:hypothetical protein
MDELAAQPNASSVLGTPIAPTNFHRSGLRLPFQLGDVMKPMVCGILITTFLAVGCTGKSTPGGPGATRASGMATGTSARGTGTADHKPLAGLADDTFTLDVPNLSTQLKQGEAKVVSIGIKRGTNFDQVVTLKFDSVPQGVTVEPASPVIKKGDTETKLTVKAADDAAVGSFRIKVTGHPARGAVAANEFELKVDKK